VLECRRYRYCASSDRHFMAESPQLRLTKRWSEPPPGACSHFQMINTVSVIAERGDGGGRSALFR
jgi:hypothetical protein